MNTRIAPLLIAGLALFAAPVTSADSEGLVGTWSCAAIAPDGGEILSTMEVKQAGGTTQVSLVIDTIRSEATEVKADDKSISFKVMYQEAEFTLEGKVDGDRLAGTWSGAGMSGEFRGTRRR